MGWGAMIRGGRERRGTSIDGEVCGRGWVVVGWWLSSKNIVSRVGFDRAGRWEMEGNRGGGENGRGRRVRWKGRTFSISPGDTIAGESDDAPAGYEGGLGPF